MATSAENGLLPTSEFQKEHTCITPKIGFQHKNGYFCGDPKRGPQRSGCNPMRPHGIDIQIRLGFDILEQLCFLLRERIQFALGAMENI
jgi:hypothetical protein